MTFFFSTRTHTTTSFCTTPPIFTIRKTERSSHSALTNDGSIPTIITGPAGTGKSLVLAEIGLLVAASNRKVLNISPTNQGVTNLYSTVRKLSEQHFQDKVCLLKLSSPAVQIGNDCDQCFRDDLGTNHRYPSLDEINLPDIISTTVYHLMYVIFIFRFTVNLCYLLHCFLD